jgi:hypothetical protein
MYHDVFQKTIEHEFSTGRYEGPFSQQQVEDILGPFQSSPISIVPKPNKPGKYRIIQNFSSPYTSNEGPRAINADIISSDFPCTWGTFETICTTILHLPPGSQAAVRDIAEAYRTIPIKPTQWPGTVVRISQSQFAIDKCLAFGCSSSAGVYGNLADASADIFRAEGIGPISKLKHHEVITRNGGARRDGGRLWFRGADWPDGSFEEFDDSCQHPIKALPASDQASNPDAVFAYTLEHVDTISERLGIPWERSKDQPFGSSFTYLGFLWDINNKLVSLTERKQEKYCQAIKDWNQSARHTLKETEKLHGKLLHTTHIIPKGCAYLFGLERLMATQRDKPHVPLTPPKGPLRARLVAPFPLIPISPPSIPAPTQVTDVDAFSDASSGTGIAFLVGQKWKVVEATPRSGNQTGETSHGPNPSPLNSWLTESWQSRAKPNPTGCTAIIESSSKAGTREVSDMSTLLSPRTPTKPTAPSSPNSFQVPSTQLTDPPGVDPPHIPPASSPSTPTTASPFFSLMPPSLDLNRRLMQLEQEWISHCYTQPVPQPRHNEVPKTAASGSAETPHPSGNQSPTQIADQWNASLPPTKSPSSTNKYPSNLTPTPSPLRSLCPAADQLQLWKPA